VTVIYAPQSRRAVALGALWRDLGRTAAPPCETHPRICTAPTRLILSATLKDTLR